MMLSMGRLAALYKFEAVKVHEDGSESRRLLADWFPNLITDYGLNAIGYTNRILGTTGSQVRLCQFCRVGSGATPPNVADTSLVAQVGSTSVYSGGDTTGAATSAPYFSFARVTYRFAQGAAAGNLSEVGCGLTAAGSDLFSRTLIKDSSGNPTTVTVLEDEFLDVTYEVRQYMATEDTSGSVTINGVVYDWVARPANVTSHGSWSIISLANWGSNIAYGGATLGPVTGQISGSTTGGVNPSDIPYVNGSFRRRATVSWSLTQGNSAGGISGLLINAPRSTYQMSFSPPLPKTASNLLSLTLEVGPWSRMP